MAGTSSDYSSDAPLSDPEKDRFNRWPFAERVAHVLRERRESSSLVVGLYGTWGEGKTTVLNYIEHALGDAEGVVVVRFNPWRFGTEATLIRTFFEALAGAVKGKLTSKAEDFASTVAKYAGILTFGGFGVDVNPEEAAKAFAEVDLEELRDRLGEILKEADLRVVVRIDDIDRLDKSEVQAVFRLVKLSADFENVAYVLALDPDVVAAALQERYGPGQERAGYDFLEKIVTVPLQLPPARPQELFKLSAEAIDEALELSGLHIEDGGRRFAQAFQLGLLPALHTPRMAKRYGNAVRFALPILAGEVDVTDQLLVEGMRVVYPKLYDHVRSHPEIYLRNGAGHFWGTRDREEKRTQRRAEVDHLILELEPGRVSSATALIDTLFPKARGADAGDEAEARRGRRAWSDWYFERYFTYAIPPDSVADRDLADLVSIAEGGDEDAATEKLNELMTPASRRRLANALSLHARDVPSSAAPAFAVAIARASDQFSNGIEFMSLSERDMASAATAIVIKNMPEGEARVEAAERVISEASAMDFALDFGGWLSPSRSRDEELALTEAELGRLSKRMADRIHAVASDMPPHLSADTGASRLYGAWARGRGREEVAGFLRELLAQDPQEVVKLIRHQVPQATSGGEPFLSDYTREVYDYVKSYVDPSDIAEALGHVYEPDVLTAGWTELDYVRMGLKGHEGVTEDQVLARQFMAVHRSAVKAASQAASNGPDEGDTTETESRPEQ